MRKTDLSPVTKPSVDQLKEELSREESKKRYRVVLRSTVYTLIIASAVAVLVATLWLPVMRIYGTSMEPTLHNGEIVFSVKTTDLKRGDIVVFYYNNKIQTKRYIAGPGDWVDIDENGTVYVNDVALEEEYVLEKSVENGDVEFPYQVPNEKIFVMGDNRAKSVDSRHTVVGCVAEEQIIGKIIFRVWPLGEIGKP